jgi:hypothetical protein
MTIKVTLSPDNTDEMPDELYDYLVEQFVAKAQEMGHDIVNTSKTLDNWRIECEIVDNTLALN